ncbi:hypothetical protein [Massilia genomosp. 1]|uniref:Uncharacterized protein n=1 Tax=Massilia genomosp. 1 TaxID=2609280 RepID=A0ABX0MSV7_9BURK|nr:hypothetical protein [Massilia genomosp. 1]NHZ62389.1 hypothetical protein [Massilia genomosp. 1]
MPYRFTHTLRLLAQLCLATLIVAQAHAAPATEASLPDHFTATGLEQRMRMETELITSMLEEQARNEASPAVQAALKANSDCHRQPRNAPERERGGGLERHARTPAGQLHYCKLLPALQQRLPSL